MFTSIAILSLALGSVRTPRSSRSWISSCCDGWPIKDPGTLVMLYQQGANMGSNSGQRMHSYPFIRTSRKRQNRLRTSFAAAM
jgi:hypothetical protein